VVAFDGDTPHARSATLGDKSVIHNVGHRPNGVVLAAGDAWVTSRDQVRLDRIDTATLKERPDHPRVGSGASSIVTQGDDVWVAAKGSRTVTRIDARTGRVVQTLHPGGAPSRLALGLGSLWVGTTADKPGANTLIRYDLNGRPLSRRTFPHGIAALAAMADALWIAERDPPTVVRFDPRTRETKVWAKLAGPAPFLGTGAGYLWASMGTENLMTRINPRTDDTDSTAVGDQPAQSVVAGDRVYVASNTDHTLVVFDPRTVRQTGKPIPMENNPYALAADSRYVWVTGLGGDTLTRLAYR
jgi:streptogramin lyase